MKNYKAYISYIFLIIFLYVFYSYIEENIELLNEIPSIQIGYIGIIFLISFINYLIKAKINIDIYSFSKIKLSIHESLRIVTRSTAINLSGPANFGAGYKLHYLKKKYGLDIIENFSINTAYAFYLNYFYIIIIFLITLFSNQNGIENSIYLNLFLLSIVVALFVFLKIISSKKLAKIKIKILKDTVEKLLLGFQYFKKDTESKRKLIVSSIVYILVSIIYLQTVMSSVGFNISLYSLLVLHCLSSVVNLIKITPGNIGFFEVSLIFFQGLHGITTIQIIIFSVVSRIVSFMTLLLFFGFDKFTNKTT
tara:strand:+ start:2735 stop:3658 length:924 start_codon:yes stop_codon:yes gene_type:complete